MAKKKTGKKQAKTPPRGVADSLLDQIKLNKYTIIVLAVSLAVFIAAVLWIYSEELFHGENEIFNPYGNEVVEFEKAKVLEIPNEEITYDEIADNAATGSQELHVVVRSGRYKGEHMTAFNYFGPYYGVPVAVGDGVTLTIKTHSDGTTYATVYEVNRIPILAGFLLLFFLVVVLVGNADVELTHFIGEADNECGGDDDVITLNLSFCRDIHFARNFERIIAGKEFDALMARSEG